MSRWLSPAPWSSKPRSMAVGIRSENEAVPYTAAELAAEARRCADEGATVFHVHARADDGGWTADPARYAEVVRDLREAVPDGLVSITSIRPEGVRVEEILDLLAALAGDPATKPDLISVNLGHIVSWELVTSGSVRRRTTHYPNAYEDIIGCWRPARRTVSDRSWE